MQRSARMKALVIVKDPPYGTNASTMRCGSTWRQGGPEETYNIERMLKRVLAAKGRVLLCGTCMDARGLGEAALAAERAIARWTSSLLRLRRTGFGCSEDRAIASSNRHVASPYTACTSITPGTALMAPAICGETL